MTRTLMSALGLVLALAGTPALAFEETKGPAIPQGSGTEGKGQEQKPPLKLDGTGTSIDTSPRGTDIRIPGLGRLGVWPKFDFGLDLLYGGRDAPAKPGETDRRLEPPSDGVQIRGQLRHRF